MPRELLALIGQGHGPEAEPAGLENPRSFPAGAGGRRSARQALPVMAAACCLLIPGCTVVGPDFQRPEVPWLAEWSLRPPQVPSPQLSRGVRANTGEWWRNFNDPVLEQLVNQAQELNPGVRTAGARIMEARAQMVIARSGSYPQSQQLSANLLESGTIRSEARDSDRLSYGLGFGIGWELDFWGKYRRAIEAADYGYLASIAQYDDVQVLVAAQAASFYCSIRTIELRLSIARENATLQKRSLEITEERFRSGNDAELDLQQAKTLYFNTVATIPELEATLRQTHNALGVLLARPPGLLPELAQGAQKIPQAGLGVIVDLPADLLRRRPDVRLAEMQLAAQSALIGVAESQRYPSIALLGSLGLSASSRNWSVQALDWAVGPNLVWNVFDWGRLKGQVLVEDARFQQLYEQYQESVLSAAREVDDAAVGFAQSTLQIDSLEQSVAAAKRSLELATVQYREGLVDFQRVLDSQKALFSQQERLVTTRGEVTQSLIDLYKAMGGGWQTGRGVAALDEATRSTMRGRSDWKNLLEVPLPPAATSPKAPSP